MNFNQNSEVINENSLDNENSFSINPGENIINNNSFNNKLQNQSPFNEHRRLLFEYIKVLGIQKNGLGLQINIKEIAEKNKIPKEFLKPKEILINNSKRFTSGSVLSETITDEISSYNRIDFDNDIQQPPILDKEMEILIFLSKPKIICFNGKLGLFFISPATDGNGFLINIKNPETMKNIFKIKIIEVITCTKKGEKSLIIQNYGNQVLTKNIQELTFKDKEECSAIHEGITYLMISKAQKEYS